MNAGNRQCYALQCLGNSLRKADMDMRARTIMDETITKLCANPNPEPYPYPYPYP